MSCSQGTTGPAYVSFQDTDEKRSPKDSSSELKAEDLLIECSPEIKESVLAYLEYTIEEWSATPKTISAVYKGNDFGDYFHLTFEDMKGKDYDFGFSENNFGKYSLYSGEQYEDNLDYLNKNFEVTWDWKKATFPCCEGSYNEASAYLPTITNLKLIK